MHKISVQSSADREKIVARLKDSTPVTNTIIEIGGEEKKVNIYNISIDAPVYNMKNFRTSGEQDTYIEEKKLPPDFFKKGQENESAQNIQHSFLLEMAKEGGAQSLFSEFESGNTFDKNDPIVVTNKLIVRDGNRRLSVLRDLYKNNRTQYEHFQKIPCAVIFDPTTEKEEELYEVDKQMKLDLKASYEWYNEALFHRHLTRAHKMSDEQISKRTRKKTSEIEKKRFALGLAEKYLKKKNKEKQYKLLKGAQQFWEEYAKMQREASKSKKRDSQFTWKCQQFLSETIAGSAASLKAEGAGRIYAPHKTLCKEENVSKAIGVLANHHNIKVKQDKTKKLLGGFSSQSKAEMAALQVKELEKIYSGGKIVDPTKILGIVEELKADKDVRYIEKEFSKMSETMSLIEGKQVPVERYDKILKIAKLVKNKINDYVDKKLSKFNKNK